MYMYLYVAYVMHYFTGFGRIQYPLWSIHLHIIVYTEIKGQVRDAIHDVDNIILTS